MRALNRLNPAYRSRGADRDSIRRSHTDPFFILKPSWCRRSRTDRQGCLLAAGLAFGTEPLRRPPIKGGFVAIFSDSSGQLYFVCTVLQFKRRLKIDGRPEPDHLAVVLQWNHKVLGSSVAVHVSNVADKPSLNHIYNVEDTV